MQIQSFPEDRRRYFKELNKDDLYRMPYSGMFAHPMLRFPDINYYAYIPEGAHLMVPAVIVIPPEGADCAAFLEDSGWVQAADSRGIIIFTANSDAPDEAFSSLIEDAMSREYMANNMSRLCAAGFGSGAAKAQRMVMKQPMAFAGLFICGEPDVSAGELASAGDAPTEVPGIASGSIPLPVWICSDSTPASERVIEYWKKANKSQKEPFAKDGSLWYLPSEDEQAFSPDAAVNGPVVVGPGKSPAPLEIWDSFFSRYGRYAGIGNRQLRKFVSEEDLGFEFCTMYVDGVRREWYQYVPESVRKDPQKKVPLVISFHGGSGMHHGHIHTTRWADLARERGFIVAFPGASLGGFSAKFGWLPHAAWNADGSPGQLNDEKFIRMLAEKLANDLPVDKGRIYSNGFSMGASFGQRMLLAMPDVFAAAALSSGVLRGDFYGDFTTAGTNEDHQRPIWVIMGEKDVGGGTFENNPDAYRYAKYWTKRNGTQSADEPLIHDLGPYHTKVYVNGRGVPMVQYSTVDNKPHSATPTDCRLMYDGFLSRFSMDEEGRTVYMEKIVMD